MAQNLQNKITHTQNEFESIFESISDSVIILDRDHRIINANLASAKITGLSKEELVGRYCYEIFHHSDRPPENCPHEQLLCTGKPSCAEMEVEALNQTFLVSISPVYDEQGRISKTIHIAKNISEQKKDKQALVESRRILNQTGKMARVGGWEHDLRTGRAFWTESLYDIIKIDYDSEPPGVREHWDYYPEEDRKILQEAYHKTMTEHVPFDLEVRGYTSEREPLWFRICAEPVLENGRCVKIQGTFQDVTKRKESEKALMVSEKKYRLLAENTLDCIWVMNMEQEFVYVNPAIYSIAGYTPEEWIGTKLSYHADLEDYQYMLSKIGEGLAKSDKDYKTIFETYIRHKDGHKVPIEIFGKFLFNEKNELVGIQGTTRDISERKKSEEFLRESEKRFRAIFEQAAVGVAQIESETCRFIRVNQRYCDILGYSQEEILGMDFQVITHPDDFEEYLDNMELLLQGEISEFKKEGRYIHKNGSIVWVNLFVSSMAAPGQKPEYHVAVIEDITARKKMERNLAQRVNELESLNKLSVQTCSNLSMELVVKNSLNGIMQVMGPDMVLMFLKEGDELVLRDYLLSDPKYQHEHISAHKFGSCLCGIAAQQGKPVISRDIHKDHRCVWNECKDAGMISFAALPLMNAQGVLGVLGVASAVERDFYHEKHYLETLANEIGIGLQNAMMYEDVKRHHDDLMKEMNERKKAEIERERLLKVLKNKNEELESIVYISSHDLRSPLLNICGHSGELEEMLQQIEQTIDSTDNLQAEMDSIKRILNEQIPASLKFISSNTVKMDSLLNGLLKLCRLGRNELDLTEIRMDSLVQTVVDSLEYQLRHISAEVQLDSLPNCYADRNELLHILTNLLDNAIRYRHPDRNLIIGISGHLRENDVVYTIADNGIGIEEKYYTKIFEVFHQLEPSASGQGQGLGLTIVKRIVDRLEGEVWLESVPGQGTRFHISLPRHVASYH